MKRLSVLPAVEWLRASTRSTVKSDILAGLTNAAIVLPQGVAFATIAGLPPEYGLYTAMVTAVVAALFGSSMVMVSGPTTAISALLFATLDGMAEPGSARFVELALLLTLLVGIFQIMAGLARLGGLVSFVSHSVIVAFTAAAALLIGVSQLAGALGVSIQSGGNVVERLVRLAESTHEMNIVALLISGATFVTVAVFQTFLPRAPGFLIALFVGAGLAATIGAEEKGVEMLSAIPAALPSFSAPHITWADVVLLAPGAAAVALVGLLEAISIGRTFALRRRESFAPNQEIVAQGLSNTVGSLFQCYAGSGSFTRSGVNAEAGAKTPLSAISASLFLAAILVAFGGYMTVIPKPAMSGLILYVAWRLIDRKEVRHIVTKSRPEAVILVLTLASGLFLELDYAIYVGVIASLSVFIYESAHPSLLVSAPVEAANGRRKFRNAVLLGLPECPQVVTVRLDGPLYFGSVEHVKAEWKAIRTQRPEQKHVIFYLKGVGKIDLAGADFLIHAIRDTRGQGGTFHIVAMFPPLLECLRRFHVIEEIGEDHLHISKGDALSSVIVEISPSICAVCTKRVFSECDYLPGAE
ncbi:SulP family inorganic anion transporter [Roseovarius sp. SK2]|jgi:SulP family sulfate permease|uniref:SulP family inorganic anion transporter n=1 Tax=Roseovarius TaxID=74030 RepID=UPI000CDD9E11|nr:MULTISPECIES: SulP family inorganic anion transporter [Roseovarius]MDD9725392.1 SulP family inorganic anion transporter [Roseovarius sp. SK2]